MRWSRSAAARGRRGGRRRRAGVHLGAEDVRPAGHRVLGPRGHRHRRHGKFIDIDVDGLHLVIHLAKAGWLRWSENLSDTRLKLGNGPLAVRVRLDAGDGPHVGFDLTEAGTRKGLAVYAVRDPQDVPGIAALGPDPLADGFELRPLLEGRRMQVKRLLRDQKVVAGIGNAYSDEILHAAKLSPFAIAADLDDEQVDPPRGGDQRRARRGARRGARQARRRAQGRQAQPHARPRPYRRGVPGVRRHRGEVVFADSSLQYCPTCQTGGKPLKDRSTSKFLK